MKGTIDITKEFPNYYNMAVNAIKGNKSDAAATDIVLKLLEKNISLLLSRVSIPHIDPNTNDLSYDNFFSKLTSNLQSIVNAYDLKHKTIHNLSICLDGKLVQFLLSYLYRELHDILQQNEIVNNQPSEMSKPEFHLLRLSMARSEDRLLKFMVFGMAENLDLILNLTPRNEILELELKRAAEKYTADIQRYLGFQHDAETYSRIIGFNVKVHFSKQLLNNLQSTNSLDDLIYEIYPHLEHKSRLQQRFNATTTNIWHDFVHGVYNYRHSDSIDSIDAISTMGPLLSIPFLQLLNKDELRQTLAKIDFKILDESDHPDVCRRDETTLDPIHLAIKEIIDNAFYSCAHNRAYRELDSPLNILAEHKFLPIFSHRTRITAERTCRGKFQDEVDKYLMDAEIFRDTCFVINNDKALIHGTSNACALDLFNMHRNGFIMSIWNQQGQAVQGSGVYSSNSAGDDYWNNKILLTQLHTAIPLYIVDTSKLRILGAKDFFVFGEWTIKNEHGYDAMRDLKLKLKTEMEESEFDFIDPNDFMHQMYNIDIFRGCYPLILNQYAVKRIDLVEHFIFAIHTIVNCMRNPNLLVGDNNRSEFIAGVEQTFNILPIIRVLSKTLSQQLLGVKPAFELFKNSEALNQSSSNDPILFSTIMPVKEEAKNDTYCGFTNGYLLNRKHGLFKM